MEQKGDRYKKRGRRKSTWSQRRYRCSKERDHQLKLETKDCQEEEETQGDDERQEKTAEQGHKEEYRQPRWKEGRRGLEEMEYESEEQDVWRVPTEREKRPDLAESWESP